jgi:uncharacterized protein
MLLLGVAGGLVRPSVLPDAHELIRLALLLAIVPALGEELLFRGLLIPRSGSKRRSVLLSASLFVLWHPLQAWTLGPPWSAVFLDPWFLTIVFVLGLLLGSIYARTASLWPVLIYSAASSSSAPPRSTETSRLTPRSTMVTPNRRCMRLIVTALWVTIR